MKNLTLQKYENCDFSEIGLDKIDLICVDAQSGAIYFCKQGVIYFHYSNDSPNLKILYDLKSYYDSTLDHSSLPNIVGMCFNSFSENLCLALSNGDVLTIDNHQNVQCVGCVASGLTAMEWSFDQEVIVLTTGENTIIVMSATFDPVVEVHLHENGFGEKQFVTVGWGKKETQFHGSEGKAAALAKSVNFPKNLRTDDGKPRISWRGDGTLFAVSVLESNNERCVRIFSRDGILQYTSEEVPGLEESLAWKPSGNLIASTQRLPNKHQIAFFEKNGLRHGEFTLPFSHDEVEVRQLAWNGDSTILAIWLEHQTTRKSFVQLWTTSNYHWYLKQSLEFDCDSTQPSDQAVAVCWFGSRLDVLTSSGQYARLEWAWLTQRSRGHTSDDGAYVAVIDGARVLLTAFRSSVPPPPMCSWEASLGRPVNALMFAPDSSNRLCAVSSDGRLAFIDPTARQISQLVRVGTSDSVDRFGFLHHWLWVTSSRLLCCSTQGTQTELLTLEIGPGETDAVTVRNTCLVEGAVISLVSSNDNIVLQLSDGKLFQYSLETNDLTALFTLPEPCSYLELTADNEILSLSRRNRLYFNENEIANNVTSFVMRPPFILLTTLQHRLLCLKVDSLKTDQGTELNVIDSIDKRLHKMAVSGTRTESASQSEGSGGRRVERGTRLITAVAVDTRVVLQMPRGNLETVQPRTLCLDVAAQYLDRKEYRKAFELFRKQRINLNLLCDHNFEDFLNDAKLFVEEIRDASWLSLFLSDLRAEDATTTTYADHYGRNVAQTAGCRGDKVDRVCCEVRAAMLATQDSKQFLQPVLASHVRQGEVGKALRLAATDLKALKFLSCLVDVDQLFNTALGLYDLELTAFVAAHSQKDPKEYLPFLNKIRKLEPNYQRYVIDEHLKRYEQALGHIALCSGDEHLAEALSLVRSHCLYSQALTLYPRSGEEYRQMALAYADHLSSKKRHSEAAILFRRAGNERQALESFILAGDWRESVTTAHKLGESSVQELCRDRLVPHLLAAQRHLEAAQVYGEVLGDVEESIAVLADGRKWEEAMWTAQRADRLDMIETHVKPGMESQLRQLTEQMTASTQLFRSYKARLAVVRTTQRPAQDDLVDDAVQDDCDLFSDRSSVSTRSRVTSSGRSSRSSKNRRKHERKLLSLKEGGAFEDLALIRALHELVTNTSAMHGEVSRLCYLLLRFDRDDDARTLQTSLADILHEMDRDKGEIWLPELTNSQPAVHFGPDATTNSILSTLQSGDQPTAGPSLIEPHLRLAPVIGNLTSWQLEML